MRKAFLGSIAMCLAGAGVSLAQPWGPPPPSAAPPGFGMMRPPGAMMPAQGRPQWSAWPSPEARGEVMPAEAKTPEPCVGCAAPTSCGPECCDCPPPLPVCPEPYIVVGWASIDHIYWKMKETPLPPVIATSSTDPTALFPGGFGQPGTVTLVGGKPVDFERSNGIKVACGIYDPEVNIGLEGSVFRLEDAATRFNRTVGIDDDGVIARPFFDTNAGNLPDVLYVAFPDSSYGGIDVTSTARFWGAEGNLSTNVCRDDGIYLDLLGGFRYYDLKEQLTITDAATVRPGGGLFFGGDPVNDGTIVRQDNFDTRNRFYGGQFGFRTEVFVGRIFANFKGTCAVGANNQSSFIRGTSQLFNGTGATLGYAQSGLLAVPSNSGRVSQDSVTVIPTFEVNVGCDITCWLRVYAGYTFIYWGNVTRPGDQISLHLDSRTIPTSPNFDPTATSTGPRNPFDRGDFWAQGVNFGIAIRF